MQITWNSVTGTQSEMPAELDTTSSKDTVYLRKNIKATTIISGESEIEGFTYDEAQLSLEEYEQYKEEQKELESEAFKAQQTNDEVIMEALADIYTMLMK